MGRRRPSARDYGCVPIPPERLPELIGRRVHLAWADVAASWRLKRIEGEWMELETPLTQRPYRARVRDAMYTREWAEKLAGVPGGLLPRKGGE